MPTTCAVFACQALADYDDAYAGERKSNEDAREKCLGNEFAWIKKIPPPPFVRYGIGNRNKKSGEEL